MTKIVTFIQLKGGATKTTDTMNTAGAFIEMGYRVKIVDMNKKQPSAMNWAARGEEFKNIVVTISEKHIRRDLASLSKEADIIFLDIGGDLELVALQAAIMADLLIIPSAASTLDLDSAAETIRIAEMVSKSYVLLAVKVDRRTSKGKTLKDVLGGLGAVFETEIHEKVAVVESAVQGMWAGSYEPGSESHKEFMALATEIKEKVGL